MLKRGLYKNVLSGEIAWVLYEIDGHVTFANRSTGKTDTELRELFELFWTYHSEFK